MPSHKGQGLWSGLLQPLRSDGVIFGVKLDAEIIAPQRPCRKKGGAGAAERVEHDTPRRGEGFHERQEYRKRLLRRMQLIAAVLPVYHVADGAGGLLRVSLGKQVGAFMLIAQVLGAGSVPFWESQMPHHAKTRFAIGGQELVGVRPSIEAHAKAVGTEYPVHLCKCRLQPGVVIIVGYSATIARLVAGDIGRVGQDEIHAGGGKQRKRVQTIGVENGIAGSSHFYSSPAMSRSGKRLSACTRMTSQLMPISASCRWSHSSNTSRYCSSVRSGRSSRTSSMCQRVMRYPCLARSLRNLSIVWVMSVVWVISVCLSGWF